MSPTREEAMIKAARIGAVGAVLAAVLAAVISVVTPRLFPSLPTNSSTPYGGTLILDDLLENNTQGQDWVENSNCVFRDGGYHATIAIQRDIVYCFAQKSQYSDFAFQVRMTIISGDKGGFSSGLILRGIFLIIFIFG